MKPRFGMIGLGIMGLPMARNAKTAGFSVTVTSRSLDKRANAQKIGLNVAATPADVVAVSDVIAIMVTGPADVREVLRGTTGVLSVPIKGKTVIQMSTIDEASTLEFDDLVKKAGGYFLDCPVSGSKKQVEAAELILEAGGDAALIEELKPLLLSMGKAVVHAGPVGKGTALKLCMNLIVAQMTTALCEAVALARARGLPPEKIFDVISHSPALNCGYFSIKEKALLNDDFSPAFSLANMLKDVRFMVEAAVKADLPLPVTCAVRDLMEESAAAGNGARDLAVIIETLKSPASRRIH